MGKKLITNEEQIRKRDRKLTNELKHINAELKAYRTKWDQQPDREEYEKNADRIRKTLRKQHRSLEHLLSMSYSGKRKILQTIFPNKGLDGVYIHRWKRFRFCRFSIENDFLNLVEGVNEKGVLYSHYLRTKGKPVTIQDLSA